MRFLSFVVFAAAAVLLGTPALSQTPPGTPMIGTVAHRFGQSPSTTDHTWCSVDRGESLFQRSGASILAKVALPGVSYSVPQTIAHTDFPVPVHYTLAGRAQLIFTSANSGKIYFDYVTTYPTTVSQPNFTNYAQNYNSGNGVLTVAFRINFPNCSLAISAVYRT